MKIPKVALNVLHNKYVLYFVLFLAGTNILGYMVMGKLTPVVFFSIVAYLTYNFSKNMIIVLGTALLLTNILMVGNGIKEGLENKKNDKDKKNDEGKKATAIVAPLDHDNQDHHTVSSSVASIPIDKEEDKSGEEMNTKDSDEGYSNKRRSKLDYAATVEDAYGDLNNILGGDGIKRLTEDTQKLMSQQLQLADAMKGMSPLMENAKSLLQGFDMKNLNELASMVKTYN